MSALPPIATSIAFFQQGRIEPIATLNSREGFTKVARPADLDQCFVGVSNCKFICTPWLILRSALVKNFAPEFSGPKVNILHVEIKTERVFARDEPTLNRGS